MNKYKIHCDDATTTMKQIEGNSIDLILTDPPYGVEFKQDFYNDSLEYVLDNMPNWYQEWYRILKPDKYLFIYVGVKTIHHWIQQGIDAGFTFKNIVAARSFNNGAPTPKNNFGFQFQPILVFSKGKGQPFNEVDFIPTSDAWLKDKRNKNPKPFTYMYPNWIKTEWVFATEKRASKNLHPNEKNVELNQFMIELTTEPNDLVFDSFVGSGSTGVAALELGRYFIGAELNKDYAEKAEERLRQVNETE